MPSKLRKLCNVTKIQLKTYVKCVYALINQLICITNNECFILYHKLFARVIIRVILKLAHLTLREFWYCAKFNTSMVYISYNVVYYLILQIFL